jgi:DNA-3-methyladenine glycosylase II
MPLKSELIYIEHLSKDKKLAPLLQQQAVKKIARKKNVCLHLMASVMSQQLSVKVAKIIYNRFLDLYKGAEPTPQQVADTPFEKLRGIGLSNAKVTYIQNIARYALEHSMEDKKLYKMSSEELMGFLLPIKGVGRWTVEMQLMFALGHEDIFAIDDLGIQQAMIKLYKLDVTDKKAMKDKMLKISAKWSPYRTYACLYLWDYKDGV